MESPTQVTIMKVTRQSFQHKLGYKSNQKKPLLSSHLGALCKLFAAASTATLKNITAMTRLTVALEKECTGTILGVYS